MPAATEGSRMKAKLRMNAQLVERRGEFALAEIKTMKNNISSSVLDDVGQFGN